MRSTEKVAHAAETANKNAQLALTVSEQAHVTIGRPDGTVAEVAWSKDANGKAGVVVYLQNTEHLRAGFNWGLSSKIVDSLPVTPCCFWWETDRYSPQCGELKIARPGGISWSGTTTLGGNSQYASTVGEIPRERMVQFLDKEILYRYPPLQISGTFEYCDNMHNYQCRNFTLFCRSEPHNRFMLVQEDECAGLQPVILNSNPQLEYLSPCDSGPEREEVRTPKGLTAIKH